ncbi:alpha-L-rhamnosidase C-terminal domain-containing protein [Mahella australiensis]|uniref:alpha-L-rhamnosidase n=1 Tax=Mahella australiensis (strain DSM 15567 / CIP 107919 / 50-1 BON) TaxID=697281 RepID=F3ZW11_MAHA5|nr:alpha-L-rhamnosidase C-terminal domain-containing protein [Mahella australiensis]AEE96391.1 alpha-L-rhamnosidase [Mahella australiensis 50-1 BON]
MAAKIMPVDLKCEYAVNPLGIDVSSPCLSWVLESHARKQAQTAYQILVATNLELLGEDIGDLWNSGKIASDESIHIAYEGKALKSYQRCFWKVRVWDSDGNLSEWSEPVFWEMGILYAHEWASKWIAADLSFSQTAPLFRKKFRLDYDVSKARAYTCGLGYYGYEEAVAASLARDVLDKHSGHHSTGITGSRHLYWALGFYGYGDIVQTILHQTTYPSIGHLFSLGATTFWETWGEHDIDEKWGPRSLNHPMQGGLDAWFYQGIAGINSIAEEPGFKHIVLRPQLIRDLTFAKAEYESIRGKIVSEWRRRKDIFEWKVSIPANTTATVYIPTTDFAHITESGIPIEQAEGVLSLETEDKYSLLRIGSGTYNFEVLLDTI